MWDPLTIRGIALGPILPFQNACCYCVFLSFLEGALVVHNTPDCLTTVWTLARQALNQKCVVKCIYIYVYICACSWYCYCFSLLVVKYDKQRMLCIYAITLMFVNYSSMVVTVVFIAFVNIERSRVGINAVYIFCTYIIEREKKRRWNVFCTFSTRGRSALSVLSLVNSFRC